MSMCVCVRLKAYKYKDKRQLPHLGGDSDGCKSVCTSVVTFTSLSQYLRLYIHLLILAQKACYLLQIYLYVRQPNGLIEHVGIFN